MLRIKDGIDLKETLPKYGFRNNIWDIWELEIDRTNNTEDPCEVSLLINPASIYKKDNALFIYTYMTFDDASNIEIDNIYPMDIIYDMIIDGIIEKVED
jgi:hypothetical protein